MAATEPAQPAAKGLLWLEGDVDDDYVEEAVVGDYADAEDTALGQLVSLPVLQDKIKRGPQSYADDFETQYMAFMAEVDLFEAAPQKPNRKFEELTMFMAQVAGFYDKAELIAEVLMRLLVTHLAVARNLHLRTAMNALSVMDNNGRLDRTKLYPGWFELLASDTDEVPGLIVKQLVKSFTAMKCHEEKKLWQRNVIAEMRKAKTVVAIRRFQYILITLYANHTWADPTTANAIAEGMFSKSQKVVEHAARFLLGDLRRLDISANETKRAVDVDEEEARKKQAELVARITKELTHSVKKKSKSLAKAERMKEQAEKELKKLEAQGNLNESLPYEILHHLSNPQSLVERLHRRFTNTTGANKLSYKVKLLLFTVCARLMGKSEIVIPGFFTWFERYVKPTQPQVTRVLAVLAQAVHATTPVTELQSITRVIANQFITESQTPQVVAVGMNTIREICTRNHQAVETGLLEDLLQVARDSKDQSVGIAGKSLRNYYRVNYPEMLSRRERGHASLAPGSFQNVTREDPSSIAEAIPGLDILLKLKIAAARKKNYKQPDEAGLLEEVRRIQSQKVLSEEDFAALRKIRVKVAAAAAMGVTLKEWLDRNPNAVEDLANQILGERIVKKKKREREEEEATEASEAKRARQESTGEGSADEEDSEEEQSGNESDDDDDESGSDSDSEDSTEIGTDDEVEFAGAAEDIDSDDDGEKERILVGRMLEGRHEMNKSERLQKHRESKKSTREEMKAKRHGGKETNRAGISNRVAARNKPMAMVKQKSSVRGKKVAGARDKVSALQKHVKTLKHSLNQRFRRR